LDLLPQIKYQLVFDE